MAFPLRLSTSLVVRCLGVVGTAAVVAYLATRHETTPAQARAVALAARGDRVEVAPRTRSESTHPLALPDPAHVDALDPYPSVRAAALEAQPGAFLAGISGNGLVAGALDLAGPAADGGPPGKAFLYRFEYLGPVAGSGEASAERHVAVRVGRGGEMKLVTIEGSGAAQSPSGLLAGALEEPTCPTRRAWLAAVESGVPADAVATFLLGRGSAGAGGPGLVWSIRVEGHPEQHREVDARTCAVVLDAARADPGAP